MSQRSGNCYRLGANEIVTVTSTSAANTTAFQPGTNAVRLVATKTCHIKFSGSPTATTSDAMLPPNVPEYFVVTPGQKVAAVRTTTSGLLSVTEVSG
jgi:hypothetical protein